MDFENQVAYLCWYCEEPFVRLDLHAINLVWFQVLVCSECLEKEVNQSVRKTIFRDKASAYKELLIPERRLALQ